MNTSEQNNTVTSDPLFKGCTRPAMVLGVPIMPLGVVCGSLSLLALWFNLLIMGLVPIAIIVMRQIVAADDQQFRLLWLKIWCRIIKWNRNGAFWRASCFSPLHFKKRNP